MNANEAKHQAMLTEWKERVAACRSSGLTVKAWCAEQGIGYKRYYRWEREVLQVAGQQSQQAMPDAVSKQLLGRAFAELPVPVRAAGMESRPVASVRIGNAALEVYAGADAGVISAICRELRHAE